MSPILEVSYIRNAFKLNTYRFTPHIILSGFPVGCSGPYVKRDVLVWYRRDVDINGELDCFVFNGSPYFENYVHPLWEPGGLNIGSGGPSEYVSNLDDPPLLSHDRFPLLLRILADAVTPHLCISSAHHEEFYLLKSNSSKWDNVDGWCRFNDESNMLTADLTFKEITTSHIRRLPYEL